MARMCSAPPTLPGLLQGNQVSASVADAGQTTQTALAMWRSRATGRAIVRLWTPSGVFESRNLGSTSGDSNINVRIAGVLDG
jgi:hypothetical protein